MKDSVFTPGVLFDIPQLKGVSFRGDEEAIYAGFKVNAGGATTALDVSVDHEPAPDTGATAAR